MLSSKIRKTKQKTIEGYCRVTKFDENEVEQLLEWFPESLLRRGMDEVVFKQQFYSLTEIMEEIMLERIFKVFDKDGDGVISVEEWLIGLSTILKDSLPDLIKYCFEVYDLDGDGYLSKDEIIYFLKEGIIQLEENEDSEECVKTIVETIIMKMDYDKDGRLSIEDYATAVKNDTLLLEAFGPCLPFKKVSLHCPMELKSSYATID